MISADVNFNSLYESINEVLRGEMWQYIAQKIKALVKKLMVKGVDVNGRAYKPYSIDYAWFRARKDLNVTANLQLTSDMWKAIQARHTSQSFEIYITGSFENDKAYWNNPVRNFFQWGLLLIKVLDKEINKYFKRLGF